jgi:hypothetical protein
LQEIHSPKTWVEYSGEVRHPQASNEIVKRDYNSAWPFGKEGDVTDPALVRFGRAAQHSQVSRVLFRRTIVPNIGVFWCTNGDGVHARKSDGVQFVAFM